ncbi:carbohydrate kinase family protein [Lewinella cohaerens]|uniref:carbohydrate kinase family protein n=1 Tax=Lewinella cohaerens TaxID=70995 RepID=UPI000381551F|nr:carbohydrate kinase family protein [Lewinella cohaerens]
MSRPIFVLGAALTDMVGFPQRKPALMDSVPGRVAKTSGGVGRNLAENLVRLGLPTELITAFGDDRNGKALLSECQELNIGVRYSILANGRKGALHLAILDENNDLYAGIADLSILEVITPTYLASQLPALEEASLICLETNTPPAAIEWLLEQELDVPIYLDPVSAHLATRVQHQLGKFHTIKVNRRQAEILGGRPLDQLMDVEKLANKWIASGVQRVFITLGSQGAYAADAERQIHLPAAKVTVADTTGAGDAFQAGLIWASLRKWSLEDCCRAGLAASTVAVRAEGAINKEMSQAILLEHIRKFC